jgi:hypothetical protein
MTYRRNPTIVFQDIDDRVMMMNPERAEFLTLSPTGKHVWYALATPGTSREIVDRLLPGWPATDPEQMLVDVEAFLKQLEGAGAVLRD